MSEMCLAYLFYYPAQNLGDCHTMPQWTWDLDVITDADTLGFPAGDDDEA